MGAALLTGAMAVPPAAFAATTVTVNTLSDVMNASDGKCSLREALTAVDTNTSSGGVAGECPAGTAGDGDVIVFSGAGTITLTANLPETNEGFTLDGGGDITIDGNAKAHRGFVLSGGSTVIRRLTITDCSGNFGGAILNYAALLVEDTTIDHCNALVQGGAINSQGGTVTIRRGTFVSNASDDGGALYNIADSFVVEDSTFSGNTAVTRGGAISSDLPMSVTRSTFDGFNGAPLGGAIRSADPLTVTDSSFTDSTSTNLGGAIYATDGLAVSGSTFSRNQASTRGGAIDAGGKLTVSRSTFTSNGPSINGGAIATQAADSTIADSTFDGNGADNGGAVIIVAGALDITGSTFSGNNASRGGAVYVLATSGSRIANSTLAGNAASIEGGAIYANAALSLANATVAGNSAITSGGGVAATDTWVGLSGAIIAGNTAPASPQATSTGIVSNSIVQDSTTGILSPAGLADNGGPTKTITLVDSPTNPAIDAGPSGNCAIAPVGGKDQRGVTRPAACDIGAVELENTAPTASAPRPQLRSGTTLSGTSERVRIAWTPSDPGGSGVKRYVVARSVNGGSWTTLTSSLTTASLNQTLGKDKSYRYRVRPVDHDGNVGAWAYGPTFTPRLVQQTSSAITYRKTWTSASSTSYSGGSVRYAKVTGASASYTFTGRSIAFVTTRAANRGSVKVYVTDANGTTVTLVNLSGATAYRYVAFARSWSSSGTRKIRIVTQSNARVDLDAFAVLK